MPADMSLKYDRIGSWSKIKLEIIENYAKAYSQILSKQQKIRQHVYIDAFAGSGKHKSKDTGEFVRGSPQIALDITPPFKEYHFIDIDSDKVNELLKIAASRPNIYVYYGDCNKKLLEEVFPKVRYEDFKRGLCLLDPYGLHLQWEVIKTAGQMESIDMILNFPIADINRNVLWHNPDRVLPINIQRMNHYWGNISWKEKAYITQNDLLGSEVKIKQGNNALVSAFRQRLLDEAGFKYVPKPLPMCNSVHAPVYYLFFASQKPVADNIITSIFDKYR